MIEILNQFLANLISEPSPALAQIYQSSPLPSAIRVWQIVSYILTPILIGLIVLVLKSFINLRKQQTSIIATTADVSPTPAPGGALGARWAEILRHMESTNESEWKFAVIEADKLVDDLLRTSGYPGETMGERLMNIDKTQLVTLDTLWDAHKIRNRLVHDNNYFLRYAEAKKAVRLYEETLKELGAL